MSNLTVQFNRHSEANIPIFEQPYSDSALQSIITNLQTAVYKYPQQKGIASEKSDSDIWRHIDNQIWGKTGNPMAIKPMLEKRIAQTQGKNILQDQKNTAQDISIANNKRQINEVNQRLSAQMVQAGEDITEVGTSVQGAGVSGLLGGLGIGSMVALGLVALLVLKK
jgi:F0F1-type ATP synthase beta subunit